LTSSALAILDGFIVRALREADADDVAALWSDPEAMRFMVGPRERESIRAAFADLARQGGSAAELWWILEDRNAGTFLGQCGLCPKELNGTVETELVYLVVPSRWGRGIASAAAAEVIRHAREALGISRIIALIEHGNVASEVVASRVGFRYIRDVARPGGRVLALYTLESANDAA
jgi:ribosomal-protein-alanine N-acetyltransferase